MALRHIYIALKLLITFLALKQGYTTYNSLFQFKDSDMSKQEGEEQHCMLFQVVPTQILTLTISSYFTLNDLSHMDMALCNSKLRQDWIRLLDGMSLEALSHYRPSYVKFSFLKWLSARGIVLSENFKLLLPSHPSVLSREWGCTYANIGPSAMTMVASSGSVGVMNLLLQKEMKCDRLASMINETDGCGYSALMIAIYKRDSNMVRMLLAHGANPNQQCFSNDRSALHLACINGDATCLKLLLEIKNINLAAQDREGRTCLHYTAKTGNLDLLACLLSAPGIATAINLKDYANGEPPLVYCARKNLDGAAELLLSSPFLNPNIRNRDASTALHVAVHRAHVEIVKALLDNPQTDLSMKDSNGDTPSMWTERFLCQERKQGYLIPSMSVREAAATAPTIATTGAGASGTAAIGMGTGAAERRMTKHEIIQSLLPKP